jgi:hypothetical protein
VRRKTMRSTAPDVNKGLDQLLSQVAELTDRQQIAELVFRLGACLDEGRFDDMRALLVEDATARTPGGLAEGLEAVISQARRNHSPEDHIQHMISGVIIELHGDEASVRASLIATFARVVDGGAAPSSLGERYRFQARRTAAGWRLSHVETDPIWLTHAPIEAPPRPPSTETLRSS